MIKKLNYILTKRQKRQLVGLLVMILIGSVFELLGVSAILPLCNLVLNPEIIKTDPSYCLLAEYFGLNTVNQFVIFLALSLGSIYIVKNVYLLILFAVKAKFTYHCKRLLSGRMMQCYLKQKYLFHVEHNCAELQRNVSGDVGLFFDTLNAVMNLLVEGITTILITAYLLYLDAIVTGMIIGILALALGLFALIFKKYQIRFGLRSRQATAQVSKWILQSFSGVKEIKVLNREEFFLKAYDNAYANHIHQNIRYNIISAAPAYFMETACICGILFAIVFRISIGAEISSFMTSLSALAMAAIRLLPAFNRITNYFSSIMFNKTALDNIYEDLKSIEEMEQNCQVIRLEQNQNLQFQDKIEVTNLTFRYPKTEDKIFDQAELTIHKNEAVAIIGESGAGKSTLADILMAILEPEEGTVFVDGVDIFKNVDSWHHTIGYIPQVIYLMDDTIRANVLFGQKCKDEHDLWEAIENAQLTEFIKSLPKGLDTNVGDRGVRLSGGQRQRIGIARALYNRPSVLILDEATSALDNETEAAVMESIEHLRGKTTLIIIAHRLSTIKNCNRIYEVANGKIALRDKKEVLSRT